MSMKLLIIGCGSIGQRHEKNAKELKDYSVQVITCDIDPSADFQDIDKALAEKPNGVIIATPSQHHFSHVQKTIDLLEKENTKILVEKPICIDLKEAKELEAKAKDKLFVVSNMRFHPAILALQDGLKHIGTPYAARAYFGHYLPQMRPNADYSSLYVASRKTGGGVLMDCIHEIDYMHYLLGPSSKLTARLDKLSDLNIEAEDYALLELQHNTGVRSVIQLDFLQKYKQRGCIIYGSEGVVSWSSQGKNPEICEVSYRLGQDGDKNILLSTNKLDHNACYVTLLEEFCKIIKEGSSKSASALSTSQEGVRALECVHAAYKAHENNTSIEY